MENRHLSVPTPQGDPQNRNQNRLIEQPPNQGCTPESEPRAQVYIATCHVMGVLQSQPWPGSSRCFNRVLATLKSRPTSQLSCEGKLAHDNRSSLRELTLLEMLASFCLTLVGDRIFEWESEKEALQCYSVICRNLTIYMVRLQIFIKIQPKFDF